MRKQMYLVGSYWKAVCKIPTDHRIAYASTASESWMQRELRAQSRLDRLLYEIITQLAMGRTLIVMTRAASPITALKMDA